MVTQSKSMEVGSTPTPGPWIVKGRVHSSKEAIRIESHHPSSEHHLYQVCDVLDANGYPQNEANLRLIASAPELLEFVKEFVIAWDEGMGGDTALYRAASKLLSKALGQSGGTKP